MIVCDFIIFLLFLQGIFSSVIKDFTGSKEKPVTLMETEDTKESIQQLSVIFSNANFPSDADNNDNLSMDEDELNIGMTMPCTILHTWDFV